MPPTHLIYTDATGLSQTLAYEAAMALYASHGFTGKLAAPPAAVVAEPPTPAAPLPAKQTVNDAGGVAARERNGRHMAALDSLGFALPDPFFTVGTPLAASGKDKFRALAVDHAQKPLIEDAAREAASMIAAEKRTNFTVALRDLTITPDGQITRGKGAIPLEPLAWEALVGMAAPVLPSAKALLRVVDPDLRAELWNRQARKLDAGKVAQIGVRSVGGHWQAFRAVSGTYPTSAQADRVLGGVAEALAGEGMRGSVFYDPASTRVRWEAAWMAPQSIDPRVGDVFRVGAAGSTADAANGGFRVGMGVTRILCVNLTIADGYVAAYRRAHRGNLDGVVPEIAATIKAVPEAFAAFAADWQIARDTAIKHVALFGKTYADVPTALAALVESGEIDAGIARDAQIEALLGGFKSEPGDTLADLLNAVTRAAHQTAWDDAARASLERRAGELLPIFARAAS